jgi:hypothetical protein
MLSQICFGERSLPGSGKREVSREWGRSIEHHRAVLLANGPRHLPKFIICHPWPFPVRGPSASQSITWRRALTRPGHRGKSPAVAVIEPAKESHNAMLEHLRPSLSVRAESGS